MLQGGLGLDTLYGGDGHDVLKGNEGEDRLYGHDGDDTLDGGEGNDILIGGVGIDILSGSQGNDTLKAGDGDDMIIGGAGRDILYGGTGNDIFDFNAITDSTLNLKDVITDFTSGEDKIDLSGIDANTSASGNQAFTSIIGANEGFSQAGQLQFKSGVLYGNNDADAQADFAIEVKDVNRLYLSDFVL